MSLIVGCNVSQNYCKLSTRLLKNQISFVNKACQSLKYRCSPGRIIQIKNYSTTSTFAAAKQAEAERKELDIARKSPYAGLTMGEKVKEAGKDVYYTGFILLGVGALGLMGYYIGSELFSGQSPNGVYTKAFKVCKNNTQVIDNFGEPLKGYGETTRRGRRRHVSHMEFMKDGVKHMRMKFYIEGPIRRGTVNLEVYQNAGKYEYRYLFIELDDNPYRTIVIEDNR